jgi:hypothetical protein
MAPPNIQVMDLEASPDEAPVTESTLRYLMFVASVVLTAVTVKSLATRVYGKNCSIVMAI